MQILDIDYDNVIKSQNIFLKTDYLFATERVVPLIDKLDIQRTTLAKKFYDRLEKDLVEGCIMPPLTLALVGDNDVQINNETWILDNIDNAFILDGIQRLNTIKRLKERLDFDLQRPIYFNLLICPSEDKLLYRMITLNNGQKPMSVRHQIEILANVFFSKNDYETFMISEKDEKTFSPNYRKTHKLFKKDAIIKAYIAFITNTLLFDNQKIIESKMDEILVEDVFANNSSEEGTEFKDILHFLQDLVRESDEIFEWISDENILIGFVLACKFSFEEIKNDKDRIGTVIEVFNEAFTSLNASKIKIGTMKRKTSKIFFEHISDYRDYSPNELLKIFSEL